MAVEERELPQLEKLYQRGLENGVKDLKILNSEEIKEVEPYCKVRLILYSKLNLFSSLFTVTTSLNITHSYNIF